MPEPLAGFTVVELTIAVQGPAAALYLRDMGAEVIKVEPPFGDPSRYGRGRGNDMPEGTLAPQYVVVNRGKQSVCIDTNTELGLRALHELVAKADVLLTNYREPALEKMGLGYERLHALHPQLIYASVNGFGPKGEDAHKAMLDGAAVARGGIVNMTGHADAAPSVPGAIIADTAGAMHLALAVLTALLARERYGQGQKAQTSAIGTLLWLQQWELTHASMTGATLARDGSHHPIILGPYGVYTTQCGGAILLAHTMQGEAWDAFCAFADAPELAIDARLQTPGQRLGEGMSHEDSAEIRSRLVVAFKTHTAMEWDDFLRTQPEIIWERVRNWQEVLADPQSHANDYFTQVNVEGMGSQQTIGNLVNLSETPGSVKGDPPNLGADNAAVLGQLDFTAEEIAAIEAQATAVRDAAIAELLAIKAQHSPGD